MQELPPPDPQRQLPPGLPDAHGDLAMRMLYEEQARLRAELERVREQQDRQSQKDDDKKKGAEDGEEGGDEEQDEDEQKEKKKDARPKPPLKTRLISSVKSHPVGWFFGIVGLILLIIVGIWLYFYLTSFTNTDDAFIDGHTDPIAPRISGIVAAVYVENTNKVRKGQLLVQLDPRDNQVSKEQAAANYEQAKASTRAQEPNVPITATDQSTQVINTDYNVVSAEANVAASKERYKSALADLQQAEATRDNAAREEERYRLLVEKEEVSREQYDQMATQERADAAIVASRRETAEAAGKAVTQAEAQLGTARQQHQQAKANLPRQVAMQHETLIQRKASELAAKAQADQAELNLQYTRIYAPEDGIIGDKQVQVASQVAAGQEMFALTQTNDIWVTANFKETQIQKMRPGQSVTIHVDALSLDFQGYVEALPGASGAVYSLLPPENATGNYVKVVQRLPVRIRFRPNQPGAERLAPGMSVEPKVWLK